jgi:type II secretory pathway component PulK
MARPPFKLPRTRWGFPVADASPPKVSADASPDTVCDAAGTAASNRDGQRGIALIIAIMIISVMMLFTSDLILSSQVNLTLATHTKDNLKAEYMAKSGLNLANLLLMADFAYTLFQAQQNPANADLASGLGDIWTVLNGIPIGGETAEMTAAFSEQFGINAINDSSVIDSLKLFDGTMTINIADESSKINVNDCYQNGRCTQVLLMLEALFSCPAEKSFLESKKVTGKELAYRIKDYIDPDKVADGNSGYSDENEPYQKRTPRQMAKNAPLDSVSELRIIEGWDADIHAVFSPYITAFPYAKIRGDDKFQININTASRGLLQCLFPESRGDCTEKVALALKKRDEDGTNLGQPGENTAAVLRNLLCYSGGDSTAHDGATRADWFKKFSTTFHVEVDGVSGGSVKKLTAVVERIMPDAKKNEKNAYRVLYWKLI